MLNVKLRATHLNDELRATHLNDELIKQFEFIIKEIF